MNTKNCPGCNGTFIPKSKIQICCSRECAISIRPHKSTREERVQVNCNFMISDKCKKNLDNF